jgi:crotonobetainyl-CoA:carnitine CoA-transferase CaiB-like acyl-CoA transferase
VRGNGHAVYAPHGTYRCQGADNWIVIVCRDQAEWEALCRLAKQGWKVEPDYTTIDKRRQHRVKLDQAIEMWSQEWDKIELMTTLQQRGVPAGAVMNAPEFMRDPHLEARGFFAELGGDHIAAALYPGLPVLIDGKRGDGWQRAPKLGEHNQEVLQQLLGLEAHEVQRLKEKGVLADQPPA